MSLTTIDGKGLLTLTNEFRMLFKEYLGLKREQNEALNNIAEALTAFAKKDVPNDEKTKDESNSEEETIRLNAKGALDSLREIASCLEGLESFNQDDFMNALYDPEAVG